MFRPLPLSLSTALLSVSLTCSLTPSRPEPAERVRGFAIDTFGSIRRLVDPTDTAVPQVALAGGRAQVSSKSWTYLLDSGGGQIFRPAAVHPHLREAFAKQIDPPSAAWLDVPGRAALVAEARRLARQAVGADYPRDDPAASFIARELLASRAGRTGPVRHHAGRTWVLLRRSERSPATVPSYRSGLAHGPDGRPYVRTVGLKLPRHSYETAVVFGPAGKPLRVESRFLSVEARRIVELLRSEEEPAGPARPWTDFTASPDLRLATFFDPQEQRFEITAHSYEGELFLTDREPRGNPHDGNDLLEWCWDDPQADVALLRSTGNYRYWSWHWWNEYGRVGAYRGSWDVAADDWQLQNRAVVHHADLQAYSVWGTGEPWVEVKSCAGSKHWVPYGTGLQLAESFYDDLEEAHVAMINTHGGMAECADVFQIRRGWDLWATLRPASRGGLGRGRLRHLFLETCSAMNWTHGPKHGEAQTLVSEWMTAQAAGGIRTIAGFDGERAALDRNGWRFFGHYNQGDSISQAWFSAMLEECDCNIPVVVAYGGTLAEAASTLLDGRFSPERADPGWAVASELITPHLADHQACCLPGWSPVVKSWCANLPSLECLDESFIVDQLEVEVGRGGAGTPQGSGSVCNTGCVPGQTKCPGVLVKQP